MVIDKNNISNKQFEKLLSDLKIKNIVIHRDILRVIKKLFQIHFTGNIHKKSNGDIELSIPDPDLLKKDGPKEIVSKHLYVNISKYINDKNWGAARCVKTGKIYDINDLLKYTPLQYRKDLGWNPEIYMSRFEKNMSMATSVKSHIPENDNMECIRPGKCTPLSQLSQDHPAIQYLNSRGFYDMNSLEDQFNAEFCTEENPQFKYLFGCLYPESYQVNPLSFTSQGRIIFNCMEFNINVLWQGRSIDKVVDKEKYIYAYYGDNDKRNGWRLASVKEDDKWKVVPGLNPKIIKQKYIITPGVSASTHLMGFDAALKWNKNRNNRIVGICEGVLDAARLGPPFCAVLGSTLSYAQAEKIKHTFNTVLVACDNDSVGNNLIKSADEKLESVVLKQFEYPKHYKDLGEIKEDYVINDLKNRYNLL